MKCEEWLYWEHEDLAILLKIDWHDGDVGLPQSCCLTSCYWGLGWSKWGMMVLLSTCQQYNYTSRLLPPPHWDNQGWCRYCVCRQMDKNTKEPRVKVSRLCFDNFIMSSQACFVVITGSPELSLDLYCDRHLTPTTQDRGRQSYSDITSAENISVLSCWPRYLWPQWSQWPLPLNCQIPKIYWGTTSSIIFEI